MAIVTILVNPARDEARRLALDLQQRLRTAGHVARPLTITGPDLVQGEDRHGGSGHGDQALGSVDLAGSDLAVSLGGDGTFLRLAPLAWAAGVPVLGVNFGRLGYLLELQPDQLHEAMDLALSGDLTLEERAVLTLSVSGPTDAGATSWTALNEIALEKTVFGHTVRLMTAIDDEEFLTYTADGLLIATPTGSTAYNLSAGGPVVSPRLRAMVVTPVAPHLSLDRSLVLHPQQVVHVRIVEERPAVLVVDGQEAARLEPGAEVVCRVADKPLRFATLGARGLAAMLRDTLAPGRAH